MAAIAEALSFMISVFLDGCVRCRERYTLRLFRVGPEGNGKVDYVTSLSFHRQENKSGKIHRPQGKGEIPRRSRPKDHRNNQAEVQAEYPTGSCASGWKGLSHSGVGQGHSHGTGGETSAPRLETAATDDSNFFDISRDPRLLNDGEKFPAVSGRYFGAARSSVPICSHLNKSPPLEGDNS